MDTSEPKSAPLSTNRHSRIVVRSKRRSKETWARILDEYMGGATARELALKHGVAVQSIYSRMNGKGKKTFGTRDSGLGTRDAVRETPAPGGGGRGRGRAGCGAMGPTSAALVDATHTASGDALHASAVSPALRPLPLPPPQGAGDALIDGGASVAAFLDAHEGIRVRRSFAPEVWRQMRRDYEEGGFCAPVIANWYGATLHAVKKRAAIRGCGSRTTI